MSQSPSTYWRQAILALQFLTRFPTPRIADFDPEEQAPCSVWFPLVGLVIGTLVAATGWFGAIFHPWLGAFFGLLSWVWATGALHLDGLGDLIDGLGAAHGNPERLRQVMSDPHTGSFAVVAIFLQLTAKLIGLRIVIDSGFAWPIILLAAIARLGPLYWARALPALAPGRGSTFADSVPARALPTWSFALCIASIACPSLLGALLVLLFWRWFLAKRLGGQTGDALGAGIEIVESVGLLVLAASLANS